VPAGPPDVHMRIAKETDLTSAMAVVDSSRMSCAFCASTPEQPATRPVAETRSASASKRRMPQESALGAIRRIPERGESGRDELCVHGLEPRLGILKRAHDRRIELAAALA
jgi:hypothetical protein